MRIKGLVAGAAEVPQPREGEFADRNFTFQSGETLPALKLHDDTLGAPKRDAHGHVTHSWAKFWQDKMAHLREISAPT